MEYGFQVERAPGEPPVGHIMHHAAAQMTNGNLTMCVFGEAATRGIINNPVELKDGGEHWQACVYVCACMRLKTLYGYMPSCRQVPVVLSRCESVSAYSL